jgi:hypothetical protein
MTLHRRKVDGGGVANWVEDGNQPMHVPEHAGWRIADGNADDIRVCGAHPVAEFSSHLRQRESLRNNRLQPKRLHR